MDRRHKREIRAIMCGLVEPQHARWRRGRVSLWLDWLAALLMHAPDPVVLLIVAAPVWIPLAAAGWLIGGTPGVVAVMVLAALLFISHVVHNIIRHARLTQSAREHAYRLCLWCQHPLPEGPNRDRCPECGRGYDARVSQALYRDAHAEDASDAKKPRRGSRYQWARALRERDR